MVLPALQKEFNFVEVRTLDGDFVLAEKPSFTWATWFDGNFQRSYDKYLEDHIGFRDFLVRLTNQIDYDLYRIPHAEGVVVGKNDQLFEFDYIRAYIGEDYIGEAMIDRKIRKLKYIQEYLKKEKDIDLVLVFEPGKATFFPEYIPDRYLDKVSDKTNFDSFLNKAIEHNVRFIDFRNYFKSLKGTTEYPLYPQYGIHWSIYGMWYAADSLISHIEHIRNIDLPDYFIDSMEIENNARRPDYDVGKTLNMLFGLRENEILAYPVSRFEENAHKEKPMVLTIGDSYYWNVFNTGLPKNLFQNEAFWYFNKVIYPDSYFKSKTVNDINLQEEIEKQDVILLMVTERFLFTFGWNFIENVYKLYGPSSIYDKIHDYKCNICTYNVWFTKLIEDAKQRNISLEKMLSLAAKYAYGQADLDNLLMLEGDDYYKEIIVNDSYWYNSLKAIASEKDTTIEELVKNEAINNFKTKHSEIFIKYNQLQGFKQKISNDSLLLSNTSKFARQYHLTLDEAIQIKAERMYLRTADN